MDSESLAAVRQSSSLDSCVKPQGLQARSVGVLAAGASYSGSWQVTNGVVSGFNSATAGLDYEIRYCCPSTDFRPTTTTTTTPRPITSSTCGRADIKATLATSRIFGGSHAVANSWPWQVLYQERKPCGTNQICTGNCGGTLLDNRHVLTAAHCVGTTNGSAITIIAGLHDKRLSEADTRQSRLVERIFMHPGWDSAKLKDDLAVLRLAQPVSFNRFVQPACLPGPEPQPGSNVVVIGWGAEQLGGSPYQQLKQALVKVVGDCYRFWGQVDDDKQICVAQTATGDSACQGDSGGPILQQHNGQWVVQGVASFVSDCKTFENMAPNVYVRVSAYLDWIKSFL